VGDVAGDSAPHSPWAEVVVLVGGDVAHGDDLRPGLIGDELERLVIAVCDVLTGMIPPDGVVLCHKCPDRVPVLIDSQGRSYRERALSTVEYRRRGHPAAVFVRRQVRLGDSCSLTQL
jgi:hypothetical protein